MASEILRFKCRQYWPIAESTTGITTRIITEDTAGSIDGSIAESSFQSFFAEMQNASEDALGSMKLAGSPVLRNYDVLIVGRNPNVWQIA